MKSECVWKYTEFQKYQPILNRSLSRFFCFAWKRVWFQPGTFQLFTARLQSSLWIVSYIGKSRVLNQQGSVFYISSTSAGDVAALVAVNTTLAACAGAVSAMFTSTLFDYWHTGLHSYDLGYTMNGCLTGLVAVTAGCATVDTWAAVIIGIVAGWVYLAASKLLIRFRIDDAVDAIPVHMVGGAWGVIATGLFTKPDLLEAAFGNTEHYGWCKFLRGI